MIHVNSGYILLGNLDNLHQAQIAASAKHNAVKQIMDAAKNQGLNVVLATPTSKSHYNAITCEPPIKESASSSEDYKPISMLEFFDKTKVVPQILPEQASEPAEDDEVDAPITLPPQLKTAATHADAFAEDKLHLLSEYANMGFQTLNQYLVNGQPITGYQQEIHNAMLEAAKPLDEAIVLHRGLMCEASDLNDDWIENRWASASLCKIFAESCSRGEHMSETTDLSCTMELHLESGVHVIAMCRLLQRNANSLAHEEQEVTIAPGAKYSVIERKGNHLVIKVSHGGQDLTPIEAPAP